MNHVGGLIAWLWRLKIAPSAAFYNGDYRQWKVRWMYYVEMYVRVRRACMVEEMSVREASECSACTVTRCARCWPTRSRRGTGGRVLPASPTLLQAQEDPFAGVIDAILEGDTRVPRKQRHTAKRIFERLRDEYGFAGQYPIVKDYVREQRRRTQEMFVPLSLASGHAQCDFGEALAIISGVECKVH